MKSSIYLPASFILEQYRRRTTTQILPRALARATNSSASSSLVARKFEDSALAERRVGILQRKAAPIFEEAMKAFLAWSKQEHAEHSRTYVRYHTSSKSLLTFLKFKNKPIDEITASVIEEYKAHRNRQVSKRSGNPITPATVNRELACLKAMYFHALKDGHTFKNPLSKKMVGLEAVALLPESNEQMRVLSYQEQMMYLTVASPTLKDIALMIETGMRPEEVCTIKRTNVSRSESSVFIPFGKTKAARRKVPLNSVAGAILKRRIESAEGVYAFPHRNDENQPMLKVNNAHTTALRNSKVNYFRLYECRHTFATLAAQNGIDLATLAAILGHSKLDMVLRYAHPQEKHKADAMQKLEKANAAQIKEFEELAPTVSATPAETLERPQVN